MRSSCAFLIVALLLAARARADEPTHLPDYKHTVLTPDQGAPSQVYGLAQTADGYLWASAEFGLWRYDGVQFERVALPDSLPRRSTAVTTLFADREGDLWIGHAWGGLTRYRQGKFQNMNLSPTPGTPYRMIEDRRGRIWVLCAGAMGNHLWRFDHGRAENLTSRTGLGGQFIVDMIQGRDGSVWLALWTGVARLKPGDAHFSVLKMKNREYLALVEAADGSIWLAGNAEMRRVWDGVPSHPPKVSPPILSLPGAAGNYGAIRDRSGTVWVVASGTGVLRFRSLTDDPRKVKIDRFPANQLSSPIIFAVLADREDNVWVATSRGIDKFRPVSISKILSYGQETLNLMGTASSIIQGPGGASFITNAGSVYRIEHDGALKRVLVVKGGLAACVDDAGAIWIRHDGRLTRLADRRSIKIPDDDRQWEFMSTCLADGTGWWVTGMGALHHLQANKVQTYPYPGKTLYGPQTIALDRSGALFATYGNRETFRVTNAGQKVFWPQGNPLTIVNFLQRIGDDLYIGGAKGVARYRRGGVRLLTRDRYPELSEVNGLAISRAGKAWIAVRDGIVSVDAKELDAAFDRPGRPLRFRQYGPQDGLEAPTYVSFRNNLGVDKTGRLWIATMDGVYTLDATRSSLNRLPPPVLIRSTTAHGRAWAAKDGLEFPKGTSQILIDFTAPSLRDPTRVQFRYRLAGHEQEWTDAGTRRQAIYTDLEPGSYTFHVIAANEDGVWNKKGAALSFTIPPTFLQSRLFHILCAVTLILVAAFLYRLRLQQIAARIEARTNERVGERERIARELHDTLLQGVQGLILGLQNVADDLPGDAPSREAITQSLDRADDLLAESRERVHDLRRSAHSSSLPESLALLAARSLAGTGIVVRSTVSGKARDLRPLVADELVRLSEEALFNVYKHAHARRVTVHAAFGRRHFTLRLQDDGIGLAAHPDRKNGPDRQFGIKGMRERAARIGGRLEVISRPGAGTAVKVTISAGAAYVGQRPLRRAWRRFVQWFASPDPASEMSGVSGNEEGGDRADGTAGLLLPSEAH